MEKDKGYKVPEGGWGYVVCFGVIITFIAGIGHINSFGLIYNDFMIETKSTAKSLTTAHGVFGMMLAIGGLILNVISKKYPLRTGGFIGASIFCIGSFSTIFINNTNILPLTFGLLQGIGFGIMVPVLYSTLNHYFVTKRTTVMSACKSGQGIILMWYPQLMKRIITMYGFRGTLLIISAISLHTFPGIAVMKTRSNKSAEIRSANTIERGTIDKAEENIDLLKHIDNNNCNETHKVEKLRYWLNEILCLKLLKDPVYINICMGQSFMNFSDLTFFIIQPMLLFQYGYNPTEVATCISVGVAADVVGRCALTIISSFTSVNTRLLYYVGTVLTFIFRIVILQVDQLIWIVSSITVLGVLRSWLHIASPLVISNYVPHDDFPAAYSMFMLTSGLVNLMASPLIGLIKDECQDYVPAFYALSTCCLPCIILWPVEYIWRRNPA
ncbi:unnamed protein product [Diatraea saccharalis]|uniref:Uncharacterized protein n=1 Tax=Diatraea saccharalis TaxID=40085 RepID=A0A9N9RH32_9NEOP|nr:unnamed protein product [Diatraea saccharalis]